jgi:excisionase family DNA binding protein
MAQKALVSVTQASEILGLGRSQILRLCNSGRLEGAEKVGNGWVIPREAIETYQPDMKGFSVVWEKRRATANALQSEIQQAINSAKK